MLPVKERPLGKETVEDTGRCKRRLSKIGRHDVVLGRGGAELADEDHDLRSRFLVHGHGAAALEPRVSLAG